MSVCIVGTHKMLGQAASLAFRIQGVEVIGAGPELCGPISGALADFEARLLRVPRLTHLIYCAADFDPDRCEREPDNPRYLSAALPPLLAALALRLGLRFISVGTHYVFSGNLLSRGYAESRSCHPVNHLGRCQLEGEKALLSVNPEAFVLRTCWVYGDEEFGPFANLLRGIIRASFSGGDLPLVNDEVASPTWARNVADALVGMTFCEKGFRSLYPGREPNFLPLSGGIYHYVDDGKASWAGFAAECARLAWKYRLIERPVMVREVPSESIPGRAPRPPCCHLACSRLLASLPFPSHGWEDYLESYFMSPACSGQINRLHAQERPKLV
jgi:dTDP-4-dehydrorhamnose reductase